MILTYVAMIQMHISFSLYSYPYPRSLIPFFSIRTNVLLKGWVVPLVSDSYVPYGCAYMTQY
jgi:hypothetical protein